MTPEIRIVEGEAIPAVHAMNERALPHVNSMPEAYFHARARSEGYFRAAYRGGEPAGFLLAMNEAADYDSLNFLWFRDHYQSFIYVDRIVVGEDHRRCGLAALLYRDLVQWARPRAPRIACEVNLRPPNEPSLRFHEGLGFAPVGTQETDGGRKTVSLMVMAFAEGLTSARGA